MVSADDTGKMGSLIERYGVPSIYDSLQQNSCRHSLQKEAADGVAGQEQPTDYFQSLCRIVMMDVAKNWSCDRALRRSIDI